MDLADLDFMGKVLSFPVKKSSTIFFLSIDEKSLVCFFCVVMIIVIKVAMENIVQKVAMHVNLLQLNP